MVNISKVIVCVIYFGMVALLSSGLFGAHANEHTSDGMGGGEYYSAKATKSEEKRGISSLAGCEIKSVKEIMEFILVLGVVNKSLKKLRLSEYLDNPQQFSLSDLLCNKPAPLEEVP